MREQTPLEKAKFQQVLTRILALPLTLGVVSAAVFVGLIVYLLSVLEWVDHTQIAIGRGSVVTTLSVDLEAGTRGFLLTGEERFLTPYLLGKPKLLAELPLLMDFVSDNPQQVERLRRVQALQLQWEAFAQERIAARRQNRLAIEQVAEADRSKQLFDEIRREMTGFVESERALLRTRTETARTTTGVVIAAYASFVLLLNAGMAYFSRRQILRVSTVYGDALQRQAEAAERQQQQAWLRDGQAQLAERLIGQQALPVLGGNVLDFMALRLGAAVAALYVQNESGPLRRIAAHGLAKGDDEASNQVFDTDDGLVGNTFRSGAMRHVTNLAGHYFKLSSGLGEGDPAEVVLVPISGNGQLNGVLELGFMRPVGERDLALLGQVSSAIGAAVEAALFRKRLQDSLEETHQLNEELQVQQEELRSANEELEEQSRVLSESQSTLEQRQVDLEQTNLRLSDQARILDRRNDALKDAQTGLERQAGELQRASRYKSEFLANMSHELRTPLNSSLILSKLLSDNKPGNLSDDQVKYARAIHSAGNDLLHLINDILDLSKVEAGKIELTPRELPVGELVASLQGVFAPLAADKGLALRFHVDPAAPASLVTDAQRLEQVLKNLLANAVKFTGRGEVSLTVASPAAGQLSFAVADTGIGIAPEHQGLIFEAFHQADGMISRRYGGTGLGLSISRDLVRLLGGHIALQSEPGEGSVFTLTLPVQWSAPEADGAAPRQAPDDAVAPIAATEAPPLPPPPADARWLLVIEGEQEVSRLLAELGPSLPYRLHSVRGVEEALQWATRRRPQAIVVDSRLTDAAGHGALQRLKADDRTREVPLHTVSAQDFMGEGGGREQLSQRLRQLTQGRAGAAKRVLLVEDDERQRHSLTALIAELGIEISAVERGEQALALLRTESFDCVIIDLKLPDMDGSELLARMTRESPLPLPPVIVYTGRHLTAEEESELNRYSRSIIVKGERSPERLLDELTLFLHQVQSQRPAILQPLSVRPRDDVFEGRKVLLVDDDVRNIFALMSALEQKGLKVEVARSGTEALDKLDAQAASIDMVLMDVMMPGMDGLEATRRIRADARFAKLPVIAITAKAMKDDQELCRKAGANDYLAKPVDLDRLFSLMRVWMPGR